MTSSNPGASPEPVWWQYGAPDEPTGERIDISDRVSARHVPGRCDRICLDTPAGPCAEMCLMDWIKEGKTDG